MSPPVRIVRLAAGGDGIGRLPDGRTVFVPRSAPGDLVELSDVREHRRFARARISRVVEPSPSRVEPRCPHYLADECGGCQLQHLEDAAQREARRSFVGDALRRLAKRQVADPEIVPAPRSYEYRTKLTLAVGVGGRPIGLHPFDRAAQVFDLVWCHITVPELMHLWQAARELHSLFPKDVDQIVLRLDRNGGRHLVFRVPPSQAWSGAPRLLAAAYGTCTPESARAHLPC
jgi:23S rRNA (uracil1939-C5)-methyltransferase